MPSVGLMQTKAILAAHRAEPLYNHQRLNTNPQPLRNTIMRRLLVIVPFLMLAWAFFYAAAADGPDKPVRKEYGIDKRVPWTTSRVIGSPEPPPPYTTEPAFPKLP